MKIKNLKINNFGKLKDKQIELKEDINIIYGENESGKSTLLKFITSMLYGINRNKAGNYASDYERFTPWSESDFSGKISYKLDNGKKYEVFRDFTKKAPKVFDENMEEVTKEFTIDKTKGSRFFVDQTQVEEELFLSTIVSEQQAVKLDIKEQNDMIQKMTNILGTGEDNISFKNTINKLNKKLTNEIGTKNTKEKPINILEKRKKELEEELKYLERFNNEKYELDGIKKEEEILVNQKEMELKFAKEIQGLNNNQIIKKERIKVLKEAETEKKKEIDELQEKLKNMEEPDEKEVRKKSSITEIALILIIGIIIGFAINQVAIKIIAIFVSLIIAGIITFNLIRKINRNRKIKEDIENKKRNYELEIAKQEKNLQQRIVENQEKENEIILQYEVEKQKLKYANKENLNNEAMEKISNTARIEELVKELQNNINESKLNLHRIELDEKNVLPKLESLSQKTEELEGINEELESLIFIEKSIIMAKENIEQAYSEMKNNISPKFTGKLSETIKKISNEKYSKVRLSDEYGLIVENEKGDFIPAVALSIGTIDQLYLSLRLATVDDISTEKLPIILDEPFAYFDDKRLENVIRFLKDNYSDRQIIIFTCTDREEKIMHKNKYEYNLIKL